MARKARVAPESSQSEEIKSAKSSNNNSLLAFENSELSSAITGKVIETNDNTNENLRLSNANTNSKTKRTQGKPRKRIARSVSEVVEEKEREEKNVFRRFNLSKCEDSEGGEGGGGDQIGSHDGKCDCCDGEGLKCGARLKWCGSKECHTHSLYYCEKGKKKAYEYERCPHVCITLQNRGCQDFCSVRIDSHFFYLRIDKFRQIKKDFENGVLNLNKTWHKNYDKFTHSFDVTPEERAKVAKEMKAKEEAAAKEAAEKEKEKKDGKEKEKEKEAEKPKEDKPEAEQNAAMDVLPGNDHTSDDGEAPTPQSGKASPSKSEDEKQEAPSEDEED